MILGLRTVIYHVSDLARAKAWYTDVFGVAPYFDEPFYAGFSVGGYELGLHPGEGPGRGAGGSTAYWGVVDAAKAWDHFLAKGATPVEPVTDVGEGIKVATVADPFGNLIGLIENPHFSPANAG